MSDLGRIPVVVEKEPGEPSSGSAAAREVRVPSGEKYVTPQGFTAIRDGIKARVTPPAGAADPGVAVAPGNTRARKPPWLKVRAPSGPGYGAVRAIVHEHRLATVCEEAKCPNIGECWNAGTATIMLM
ncbi:MAG TPA: hypothetical protein VEV18_07110, partial [Steroidobacteraceae bacterium]|nr:hypothetical protein [Steroidobacteraceae bacterium]